MLEGKRKAQAAWWILGSRRLALESLELNISGSESGYMQVHATAILRGRVSGLSPGDQDVEIELEVDGARYRIAHAQVFDVDLLASGESLVQVTGVLEPVGLPEKAHRGGLQ